MNKDQALNYYYKKHDEPASLIREFKHRKNGTLLFVINDFYAVREITPVPYNGFTRNQNFKSRISGLRISKSELNELLKDKYHTHELVNTWINC